MSELSPPEFPGGTSTGLAAPHHRDRRLSLEIVAIAADLASPQRIAELAKAAPLSDFDNFFAIFDLA